MITTYCGRLLFYFMISLRYEKNTYLCDHNRSSRGIYLCFQASERRSNAPSLSDRLTDADANFSRDVDSRFGDKYSEGWELFYGAGRAA